MRGNVDYDEFPEGTRVTVTFNDCCASGEITGTLVDVREYDELVLRDAEVVINGFGLTVEKASCP